MVFEIVIKHNDKPDKKYMAIIDNKKTIHFGAKNYSDYTMHHDDERKQRYLQRHKHDHYTNPLYASFYSTNLLWNKSSISESIKDTNDRFKNINVKNKII